MLWSILGIILAVYILARISMYYWDKGLVLDDLQYVKQAEFYKGVAQGVILGGLTFIGYQLVCGGY